MGKQEKREALKSILKDKFIYKPVENYDTILYYKEKNGYYY